jgi:hypothetical protein
MVMQTRARTAGEFGNKAGARRLIAQWSGSPRMMRRSTQLQARSRTPRESGGSVRRNPPRSSPRSSTRWSQGCLLSIPERNLDGKVSCDSARTLGRNLTRYPARNRTRSSGRCSRGSGRSSGGNSRTSSPRRSSGYPSGRDFGDHGDSYGGGIGGVGMGTGVRGLGLGKLGPFP